MIEQRKTILLVEDVEDNRDLVSAVLGNTYEIIEAVNGREGLEIGLRAIADLILMDISLPEMNGLDVTRRLRMEPGHRQIPIIALTAHAMVGDRERALEAGCDDYLSKPLIPKELRSIVNLWINKEEREKDERLLESV